MRLRISVFWILALLLGVKPLAAQMTEEQKRRLFLESRDPIRPVKKPSPSPTPRPKPAAKPASSGSVKWVESPRSTPRPSPKPTPKASSASRSTSSKTKPGTAKSTKSPSKAAAKSTPAPRPIEEPTEEMRGAGDTAAPTVDSNDYLLFPGEEESPRAGAPPPRPAHTETAIPRGAEPVTGQIPNVQTPAGRDLSAPIQIEKSGLLEDSGYQPPAKSAFGGFMQRWRHLSPAVRKAIDQAKVRKGRWKYIIVHNSGTRQGNARVFDNYHRRVRKMRNGMAYHFVIGNGQSSGNGQIEIGNRWTRQINGGHVASDYLNDISIGICLVGDLNRDQPTKAQLEALDELCTYLRGRVGKVKGRPAIVKGHKEINPKPTDCPGDRFPLAWLRKRFGG